MPSKKNDSPVATALRNAGFIPLPRLWVKPEDMDDIHKVTDRRRAEVNEIRAKINYSEK